MEFNESERAQNKMDFLSPTEKLAEILQLAKEIEHITNDGKEK